jgi:hypothetical protein
MLNHHRHELLRSPSDHLFIDFSPTAAELLSLAKTGWDFFYGGSSTREKMRAEWDGLKAKRGRNLSCPTMATTCDC